ncbi:DUF86 domain-containing protein [Phormidesmis priestleyi ULC007]|uniref:DUF86 domain-containing protein n=1 Tax=Phormidesmis priestleyi ULC007 TaxID=1920490 RepID=A0A2T1DIF9_9CYAN|nr:DUF86 domain-containing protein [Phormidesmis priestleyi]PSB20221.1 DUF86 domain-containing protein [Phormidesmis priestleyi ULC007]
MNRKLKSLVKNLNALKHFENVTLEDYLNNYQMQLAVERSLELIIQASLDINRYLLKRIRKVNPKENAEVFLAAGQYGLLTPELGLVLSEFGKFRNVLVHLYEDINPNEVFSTIRETLEIYPTYAR